MKVTTMKQVLSETDIKVPRPKRKRSKYIKTLQYAAAYGMSLGRFNRRFPGVIRAIGLRRFKSTLKKMWRQHVQTL